MFIEDCTYCGRQRRSNRFYGRGNLHYTAWRALCTTVNESGRVCLPRRCHHIHKYGVGADGGIDRMAPASFRACQDRVELSGCACNTDGQRPTTGAAALWDSSRRDRSFTAPRIRIGNVVMLLSTNKQKGRVRMATTGGTIITVSATGHMPWRVGTDGGSNVTSVAMST
jgi:hypothetical protein